MQYHTIRFILSFLTSIIMLGHTLVSHHHAEEHGHGHHHSHHHEDNSLKDLFTHHCHSADSFTYTHKHEISHAISKQLPDGTVQQPWFALVKVLYKPQQHHYSSGYIYISPHLVHLDFRGPPMQAA